MNEEMLYGTSTTPLSAPDLSLRIPDLFSNTFVMHDNISFFTCFSDCETHGQTLF